MNNVLVREDGKGCSETGEHKDGGYYRIEDGSGNQLSPRFHFRVGVKFMTSGDFDSDGDEDVAIKLFNGESYISFNRDDQIKSGKTPESATSMVAAEKLRNNIVSPEKLNDLKTYIFAALEFKRGIKRILDNAGTVGIENLRKQLER